MLKDPVMRLGVIDDSQPKSVVKSIHITVA
jgi:hypothetical protein